MTSCKGDFIHVEKLIKASLCREDRSYDVYSIFSTQVEDYSHRKYEMRKNCLAKLKMFLISGFFK